MLQFENTITLDKKIAVIIPTCECNPYEMNYMEWIDAFNSFFSTAFGGSTTQDIKGWYKNNNLQLEYDESTMVYAWYSEMTEQQEDIIKEMVLKMKDDLHQECIGVEYEGKFNLVF